MRDIYSNQRLILGKQGENNAVKIRFELDSWRREFGEDGVLAARHKRNRDDIPYPISLSVEDNYAVWTVTSVDNAIVGRGELELVYMIGDVVVKSTTIDTYTYASNTATAEVPDAYDDWLVRLQGIEAEIHHYADGFSEAAQKAIQDVSTATERYVEAHKEELRGPQGIPGAEGPRGYTPVKGIDYFDGEKGDRGEKGDKGDKGNRGDAGYTPIKGVDYFDGEKGDKGDRGVQGPKGDKGDDGIAGPTGPKGDTGESGVYIGDEPPADSNVNVWVIPDGDPDTIKIGDIEGLTEELSTEKQAIESIEDTLPSKLTEPSAMSVGQFFRIASFDENGHAVLEAVDAPSGGVSDVKVNNASVVADGVANIPLLEHNMYDSYGLARLSAFGGGLQVAYGGALSRGLTIKSTTKAYVSEHHHQEDKEWQNLYQPITLGVFDYAVKCAMTDGKGAEWTDAEKANAQIRIGIVTLTQEEYNLLDVPNEATLYFVKGVGIYIGSELVASI